MFRFACEIITCTRVVIRFSSFSHINFNAEDSVSSMRSLPRGAVALREKSFECTQCSTQISVCGGWRAALIEK